MENTEAQQTPWQQDPTSAALIWATPEADKKIGHIARVSNSKATPDDPSSKLIGYLLRNHHWSPFQMVNLCIEVTTTRDISAQILRHASIHFQEFSTRYADVEELLRWKECRFQDDKNRQNSFTMAELAENFGAGTLTANHGDHQVELGTVQPFTAYREVNGFDPRETVAYWDALVNEASVRGMEGYQEARRRGVAKETARAILPFGLVPTRIYMNATVRSWIHYISERTKPGVQKEHRDVALACEHILANTLPDVYAAYVAWKRTEIIKDELYKLFAQDKIGLFESEDRSDLCAHGGKLADHLEAVADRLHPPIEPITINVDHHPV